MKIEFRKKVKGKKKSSQEVNTFIEALHDNY